jgi:hypothetical protein
MSEKENDAWKYRVCLRIDSDLGTRRQDSAEANSGITFIDANTGDHGKINILLSKDSFTSGMNRAVLEIYSKRVNDNDTLICSAEWTFRAAKNPTGENAGTVYPSLIKYENDLRQLVSDAEDAIDACEDATEAANQAEQDAGHAAQDASIAANSANTAAQGANAAANAANNAASAATSSALVAGSAAQNADAKAAEAEAAAATARAITQTFVVLPHEAVVWDDGDASFHLSITKSELLELKDKARFALEVETPTGSHMTLYEYSRVGNYIGFKTFFSSSGASLWATLGYNTDTPNVEVHQYSEIVPTQANVSNGRVTFKDRNDNVAFFFDLPIYNGGVS